MNALVIGAGGMIGGALCKALVDAGHEVYGTTRAELDLLDIPDGYEWSAGHADVVYICAAKTRFIDCESDRDAYRINVDAPIEIAKRYSKVVYLSSEAVERALHTNYGMHKALAEIGIRAVCHPVIARLSKVDKDTLPDVCAFLVGLADAKPGVYHWSRGS